MVFIDGIRVCTEIYQMKLILKHVYLTRFGTQTGTIPSSKTGLLRFPVLEPHYHIQVCDVGISPPFL